MRRAGVVLVALLCAAPLASARSSSGIAPGSIAGIGLGMSRAKARTLLGTQVRLDRLEDGYERLVSTRLRVEVYFRKGTVGVAEVTTWSRTLRTAERVGACSTVSTLKAAYGSRLVPFKQAGKTIAYRIGSLVFATGGGSRVRAVALGRGTASTFVALNVTPCS
jgi:hypothetical protein